MWSEPINIAQLNTSASFINISRCDVGSFVIFSHKSTAGFDGTSWFIWRVQVREQPPDYKTYYIPRGSNFALSVPSQGQWYTFSTPTGGPISSSQDFVVKERGSMFIVINFRDELSGNKQL